MTPAPPLPPCSQVRMKIAQHTIARIDYVLKGDSGDPIDSSEGGEPLAYLHGVGSLVPGLESALEGKEEGDNVKVVVPPDEGYGHREDERVFDVPRDRFESAGDMPDLQTGMNVSMQGPEGVQLARIAALTETAVTLDANHPLAGETLHFDVTIREVRAATPEEIEHGHAH